MAVIFDFNTARIMNNGDSFTETKKSSEELMEELGERKGDILKKIDRLQREITSQESRASQYKKYEKNKKKLKVLLNKAADISLGIRLLKIQGKS